MPASVLLPDGYQRLTRDTLPGWLGRHGVALPGDAENQELLPLFLRYWDKKYQDTPDQARQCLVHLQMYVDQFELLRGIRDLGDRIIAGWPPQAYLYVGVGRSPAPLMAYFENIHLRAFTIPLSDFRPRHVSWSITDDSMVTQIFDRVVPQARITAQQQLTLFAHFANFFPAPPPRPRLLLIDYTGSGKSLVASQEQMQAFFAHRGWDVEVHALAICKDSDEATVRDVGATIASPRSPLRAPLDWWSYSSQRASFGGRWHVLPVARLGHPQSLRQQLVMRAFSTQRFDELAEYGSFKVLSQPPGTAPVRYTQMPGVAAAFDVLRQEMGNV